MARILCFGEVLWDLLPRGRFLGGAPLNVAYHLRQLGFSPALASAVGCDALGAEALQVMKTSGLDISCIQITPTLPTGTATVLLDDAGQATFQLPEPVAWDEIAPPDDALFSIVPAAVVFGTLALRRSANRVTLTTLLDRAPNAFVVCDLNLRPPHDDIDSLESLLYRADLLKLNEAEARQLCPRAPAHAGPRALAEDLSNRYGGTTVCLTRGPEGAGLLTTAGAWHESPAPRVTVCDTIGAGDAYAAALLAGIVRAQANGHPPDWPRLLAKAAALGAFVASRDGAQPAYDGFKLAV